MENLIQIIYISRSTFVSNHHFSEIEPNVARILAKSRINNKKNGLVGVLYFGDGCFFQCLEGEKDKVEKLYQLLSNDPRHKDLKILSKKEIANLSFTDWAMKYVPIDQQMLKLLKQHGYTKFDPYIFSSEMIRSVMELLRSANDIKNWVIPEEAIPTNQNNNNMSKMALVISILSLLISLYLLVILKK